ncbi:bli-3 protein [Delitschia confertaspora ATCC 74209]|uniref:Bli-3 protein n=1 Tax=Delitschia confertaspora ATCC 74209 TaxID=1513339 RepID=A0A9P4JI41_9PLEO|nr:bli-3 protein [Delitschia confertaspora ATCC 74209]
MASYSNADTGSKPEDPYKQKNVDEPSLKEKVEDLVNFIDKHKFCMMTTQAAHTDLLASRCMALAAKANGLDLLFHANTESGKTDDLHENKSINIAFLTPSGEWASISGHASIETDRAEIRKYYSPSLKAWVGDLGDGIHDGGPEDPRICVIRVRTTTAQYAVSRRTMVGAMVELAKGTVTGEAPSVNKLRYLSEEEVKEWKSRA